jgi:hypothetical protein
MWTAIFETIANNERLSSALRWNLLLGDVLATVAVGCGIVWEHGPEDVRRVADKLVLWGIVAETLCSVALFTVDGGIGEVQQSKIIALETRIAPRWLTLDECRAVSAAMHPFSGKRVRVQSYSLDAEGSMLAAEIIVCLEGDKTVEVEHALSSITPLGGFGSGVFVDGSDKGLVEAIRTVLGNAKLVMSSGPGWFPGNIETERPALAPDANVVVGVKPVPKMMIE